MDVDQLVFRVIVLKKGGRFGLLLKTETPSGSPIAQEYFYLAGTGLEPTKGMRRSHELKCTRLESFEDERLLVDELISYAEAADAARDPRVAKRLSDPARYRRCLEHFFEPGRPGVVRSPVRDFFVSREIFEHGVLQKPRRKNYLVGKAAEFRVVSPDALFSQDRFAYLRHAEDLLETTTTGASAWFRRRGPVAKDFEDGRVYRRQELLDALKSQTWEHRIMLLEGGSATGKTTLVRHLAYELHTQDGMPVYYFRHRPFEPGALLLEIRNATGLVILEDAHLDPPAFQELFTRLRSDSRVRILFTARPSLRAHAHPNWKTFDEASRFALKPFQDAHAIVAHFMGHPANEGYRASASDVEKILRVSQDNFWLLAYALMGFAAAGPSGDPLDWIADRINKDLFDLKLQDRRLPRTLLALCPLSMNEVFTAESYLSDTCSVDVEALDILAREGEAERAMSPSGHVLYRLPHSTLARAYWECGSSYRRDFRLPDRDAFVTQYARASVPNPLEALLLLPDHVSIWKGLDEGILLDIFRREESLSSAEQSISLWRDADRRSDFLTLLACKLESSENVSQISFCLEQVARLGEHALAEVVNHLRPESFARAISNSSAVLSAALCLWRLRMTGEFARETCRNLILNPLVLNLDRAPARDTIAFISSVSQLVPDIGTVIWKRVDQNRLAQSFFDPGWYLMDIAWMVRDLYAASASTANEFIARLGWSSVAECMYRRTAFREVSMAFAEIRDVSVEALMSLWDAIDVDRLVAVISMSTANVICRRGGINFYGIEGATADAEFLLEAMRLEKATQELLESVDWEGMSADLDGLTECRSTRYAIRAIERGDVSVARRLLAIAETLGSRNDLVNRALLLLTWACFATDEAERTLTNAASDESQARIAKPLLLLSGARRESRDKGRGGQS